jgi:hypothetical protein
MERIGKAQSRGARFQDPTRKSCLWRTLLNKGKLPLDLIGIQPRIREAGSAPIMERAIGPFRSRQQIHCDQISAEKLEDSELVFHRFLGGQLIYS